MGWLAGGTVILMLARLASLARRRHPQPSIAFAAYLALVGCCALAAYTLTCAFSYPIVRYFSLALLIPIGGFAAFVAWEGSARLRTAAIVVFVAWGSANLVDHARVIRAAIVHPPANPHAELTAFLLSRQIRYARANYWDAYVVDFLSRERVIVGSYGPVRIPDYERLVDEHSTAAVSIERMPCEGPLRVVSWCISMPGNRLDNGAR